MEAIKRRRRLNADEWGKVFDRFEDAGVTVGEFCKRERICVSSFHRWRARADLRGGLGEDGAAAASNAVTTAGFLDLGLIGRASPSPAGRLDVHLDLGGGVTLHIVRG